MKLSEFLGWNENVVYEVEESLYKIEENSLYEYRQELEFPRWIMSTFILSNDNITKFQNTKISNYEKLYYFYSEELEKKAYISIENFKKENEKIKLSVTIRTKLTKSIFTEEECNYLKEKYCIVNGFKMIEL